MGEVPATDAEASRVVTPPEVLADKEALGPWSGVMAIPERPLAGSYSVVGHLASDVEGNQGLGRRVERVDGASVR